MLIDEKTVQEILTTSRIEDVVEEYVNLKRRGVNMIGLCPFHNEKTPSFTVSPAKNLYKCFGCGKGGSSAGFLMEHEQFTYPEALKHLAKKYGIKIEEVELSDEAKKENLRRASLLLINEFAKDYFIDQLFNTKEGKSIGLSYFKHRGLLESTMEAFGLGYSSAQYEAFTTHSIAEGYKKELLGEIGLISNSGRDFFRERVIFPFFNLSGKVIGFGGRILKDNVKAPKYVNSKESSLYNKRKTLYGLFQAKQEIRKQDKCILVEGYTDVISLWQNGVKNVVASSGTSLTNEQVRLIRRFTNSVLVLYDGDQAGQAAALRGLHIFLDNDVDVEVVMLPDKADPDSYMREVGSTKFSEYLETESKDFILFLCKDIQKKFANDPIKKSVAVRDLIETIAKISDQLKRQLYVKECALILDMTEEALVPEVNKALKKEYNKKRNQRKPQETPLPYFHPSEGMSAAPSEEPRIAPISIDYQERDIVRILLKAGGKFYDEENGISIAEYMLVNLAELIDLLKTPAYVRIIKEYRDLLANEKVPSNDVFINHPEEHIRNIAIDILAEPYVYANWENRGVLLQTQKPVEENYVKDSFQSLLRIKLKMTTVRIEELNKQIQTAAPENMTVYLTVYQKLKLEQQNLADQLNLIIL